MVAVFVILTIGAFIAVDSIVQWSKSRKERALRREPMSGLAQALAFEGVRAPSGLFLDPGHTWVRVDASGRAQIGLDDFAQNVIGRIDEVELPKEGQDIRRGEKLFAIRQGDRKTEFPAPVDGVAVNVNSLLAKDPSALKQSPYKQGWVCAITPKNLAKNLRKMLIAEETAEWFEKEKERFREFIAVRPIQTMTLGRVLQDGGQLTEGVLELMDQATWDLFNREFILRSRADEGAE